MTRQPDALHDLLGLACDLLNGDVPIPRAPRRQTTGASERSVERAKSRLEESIRNAVRPGVGVPVRLAQALKVRTDPLTRQDVLRLADFLRAHLRYGTYSLVGSEKPTRRSKGIARTYAESALPIARESWLPRPTLAEYKAESEWTQLHFDRFNKFILDSAALFGWDNTHGFLTSYRSRPTTPRDAYVCLLVARILPDLDRTLDSHEAFGRRIAVCLGCGRFFVAVRPDAGTCSPTCRQRLYRKGQKDAEAAARRLKEKEQQETQRKERERAETMKGRKLTDDEWADIWRRFQRSRRKK